MGGWLEEQAESKLAPPHMEAWMLASCSSSRPSLLSLGYIDSGLVSYMSHGPFVTGSALCSAADCDAFFHLRCDRDAGERHRGVIWGGGMERD